MARKNKKKRPAPAPAPSPAPEAATEPAPPAPPAPEPPKSKAQAAKEAKEAKKNLPVSLRIKENVEAFFFAIILVLVIRYFSVEAYQIPTKSMEPTLIGDPINGDRILVDKFIYNFTDPQRWDVVVFKYPLNRSRNFIKRLVGRGGERIGIKNGNVFFDGSTARKPEKVQDVLWKPVYEGDELGDPAALDATWSGRFEAAEGGGTLVDRLGVDPAAHEDFVAMSVKDSESPWVPDVRFAFEVDVREGEGGIRIVLETDERLPAGEDAIRTYRTTFDVGLEDGPLPTRILVEARGRTGPFSKVDEKTVDFRLARNAPREVEAHRVDGWARLLVGGDLVAEVGADLAFETATVDTERSVVRFAPVDAKAVFQDFELERDIYYTNAGILDSSDREIEIPPGRYLLLGDNSDNSRDSRLWSIFRITTEDGQTIEGEFSPGSSRNADERNPIGPSENGKVFLFRDTNGFERRVRVSDVRWVEIVPDFGLRSDAFEVFEGKINLLGKPVFRSRSGPMVVDEDVLRVATVADELIVGRAFFVFWPPVRGDWDPHWKFIR